VRFARRPKKNNSSGFVLYGTTTGPSLFSKEQGSADFLVKNFFLLKKSRRPTAFQTRKNYELPQFCLSTTHHTQKRARDADRLLFQFLQTFKFLGQKCALAYRDTEHGVPEIFIDRVKRPSDSCSLSRLNGTQTAWA
jgi:hypothetical protein